MPVRLAVRVPRTYTDKEGKEQRRYTDAGTAFIPNDADRVDINIHPGLVIATAIVMMPRDAETDATLPLPAHVCADRYNVTTSWQFAGESGKTVTRYVPVGVLFRNRAGTGFNLRVNDNCAVLGRVVAFPADRDRVAEEAAVADTFDDDLEGLHEPAAHPDDGDPSAGTAPAALP